MKHYLREKFYLELGGVLDKVEIEYQSYGSLNDKKDNVIFVAHALTANADAQSWWPALFGKGKLLDDNKYFIICANNIGSPYGSTSPNSIDPNTGTRYGLSFPQSTIRDTARLHLKLLEDLKLTKIKYIIGGSCGGNIALEMAVIQPDLIQNMILLCCSAKESPWLVAIHEAQRQIMMVDPTFNENRNDAAQRGLSAARGMAMTHYRSPESFNNRQQETDLEKTSDFKASSYIIYQGEKFKNRFDTHSYFKLLSVLDTHNIGRNRHSFEDALACVEAKTLIIGFDTDNLVPVEEQRFLAENISGARFEMIETPYGHDAFLIETTCILEKIGLHFQY